MHDRSRSVPGDRLCYQLSVTRRASDEWHFVGQQKTESGRQVVEYDHWLAEVSEFMHHVAADIAGAASDQDRHESSPLNFIKSYNIGRERVFRPRPGRSLWRSCLMLGI